MRRLCELNHGCGRIKAVDARMGESSSGGVREMVERKDECSFISRERGSCQPASVEAQHQPLGMRCDDRVQQPGARQT